MNELWVTASSETCIFASKQAYNFWFGNPQHNKRRFLSEKVFRKTWDVEFRLGLKEIKHLMVAGWRDPEVFNE